MKTFNLLVGAFLVLVTACQPNADIPEDTKKQDSTVDKPLFERISNEKTGITFTNSIKEDDSLNVITYDYFYNGGGVAILDVNKDGFQDLFFSGNQVPDELYLNKGNFQFENVTEAFGINVSNGWSSGAVAVDINTDGWMDLYVCKTGPSKSDAHRTNQLFINQQGAGFSEEAEAYGLDYVGHSSTAAFFDADLDGDLDCYILTHPGVFQHQLKLSELEALKMAGELESDAFFENVDQHFSRANAKFGIQDFAFGLGLAIEDVNLDGWPDIYVSNDFDEGDLLYINQHGTFENQITQQLKHTSNYGMGCDIADFNNDFWPDILTTDMAFESHQRAKRNMASMNPERFKARLKLGWHYQYMNNTLQLNNADGTFSDIAQVSGVNKTDWSWAALFADFDNDGLQDIFISNGYKRDTKDNDLKANVNTFVQDPTNEVTVEGILNLIPSSKLKNYIFKNEDGYIFSRMLSDWGLDEKVNTNGAAYADLDNDGDLDLVLNNIDENAFIYENSSRNNWIAFNVDSTENSAVRIRIYAEGLQQQRYKQTSRGYLSSVDSRLFFGLDQVEKIDSAVVINSYGSARTYHNLKANTFYTVNSNGTIGATLRTKSTKAFNKVTRDHQLIFKHEERNFNDFKRETLLPHKLSTEGPGLAVADINGDGLDDVWIGGGAGQAGAIFIQNAKGSFSAAPEQALTKHADREDIDGLWFDADSDGDLDLFVVSGSSEFDANSTSLRDRLYLNDGQGHLTDGSNRIPALTNMGACVVTLDYDDDGDFDLVIGTRGIPGAYPTSASSVVLENNRGLFQDVTMQVAPAFAELGMVKDIAVLDANGDGLDDLVFVGEFMAPQLFINQKGSFNTGNGFPSNCEGWWQSVTALDVDGDGDLDLVLGNIGENNKFHPSVEKPLFCYANDFDSNGTLDIVLAKYEGDVLYPVRGKECSSEQMPFISKKFKTYKSFAESDLAGIYSTEKLENALKLEAKTFSSYLAINDGNGNFSLSKLPSKAQFAPINSVIPIDINSDGALDLICNGNLFETEVETTRYDAGNGLVLFNDGNGMMRAELTAETGLSLPGDTRKSALIKLASGGNLLLVVTSNGFASLIQLP